jgi:hypothetical protein
MREFTQSQVQFNDGKERFIRSQMQYDDGYYRWTEQSNSQRRVGTNAAELNRTEGYEVLDFINHISEKFWRSPDISTFHKIEKMIRHDVPPNMRAHEKISDWIVYNWDFV